MTYVGNPNSQNQRWSMWTFLIHEFGRHVPKRDVEYNAARWLAAGFGRAGRARVKQTLTGWRIDCLVEGPTAHDPAYVESVHSDFQRKFVEKGWGSLSFSEVSVKLVAGSKQDGKPSEQLIEMPVIREHK